MGRHIIAVIGLLLAVLGTTEATKRLTTETFEHLTQAATGQTTGVWLVRFCSYGSPSCRHAQDKWDALAEQLLEEQVFCADVDMEADAAVAERFGIREIPYYLLLRNRRAYLKGGVDVSELEFWALAGWRNEVGMVVPPESSGGSVEAAKALSAAVNAARGWIKGTLAKTRSQDSSIRLQAQAQLALPVLLSCLAALVVMLLRVKPAARPARGKAE